MLFLIANNGLGYYQFFTCFFLILTGISKTLKTKKIKYLLKSIICITIIVIFVLINVAPIIIKNRGKTSIYERGIIDAEMYGLKIIQLLLPVNSHGISKIRQVITVYNSQMPLVNENRTSYLGIMGICGFIILLINLLKNKESINLYCYQN